MVSEPIARSVDFTHAPPCIQVESQKAILRTRHNVRLTHSRAIGYAELTVRGKMVMLANNKLL
jgi:hypothetical protein